MVDLTVAFSEELEAKRRIFLHPSAILELIEFKGTQSPVTLSSINKYFFMEDVANKLTGDVNKVLQIADRENNLVTALTKCTLIKLRIPGLNRINEFTIKQKVFPLGETRIYKFQVDQKL